ncbi:exosortase/archaeosortase family protein [Ruficoccus amylovorans]|uniref:Exosortase/archaeosortase family protein n=1 Tax=Ruficoccus amylovorans TaxID=1804625 RepID=A0A842HK05_9BACT|nr:exosortase/archaeosortase family protein [Ruficoccus amylovorans]MBC2596278.1 exosortase/archaeosortase family protein [Ruficoccus amylovorans]
MNPPATSTTPASTLWLQRLTVAALIAVCLGPFLVNTTSLEKSRMAIKAVAIAAGIGCVALNRARFRLRPSPAGAAAGLGLILLGGVLTLADAAGNLRDPGLGFILGAAGVSLIACGFTVSGLQARCLGLFALAAIPAGTIENLIEHGLHYSTLIAKLSAFSLHYVGFTVQSEGNTILIHGHAVEIIAECSGLKLFFMLFAFFAILQLALPELRRIFWKMLFAAAGTGLIVSVLRIDFLVLIVGRPELFEFFHHGFGSELISMAAILIFGFFIKEEAFTALEKKIPVPAIPADHLPTPDGAKLMARALVATTLIGVLVATAAYLTQRG